MAYNPRKGVPKSGRICPSYSSERERENATGVYYLVREVGPTLISRRTAFSGMGNGDDDNDDDDGARKIPSKRKAIDTETKTSTVFGAAAATEVVNPSKRTCLE
jgi:hypothetical protein